MSYVKQHGVTKRNPEINCALNLIEKKEKRSREFRGSVELQLGRF